MTTTDKRNGKGERPEYIPPREIQAARARRAAEAATEAEAEDAIDALAERVAELAKMIEALASGLEVVAGCLEDCVDGIPARDRKSLRIIEKEAAEVADDAEALAEDLDDE